MWGCYFAGIPTPPRKFLPKWALRGRASVTGGIIDGNPPCNGPIAGIWIHDAGDMENVIAGSITALNSALKMNKCEGSPTVPWTGLPAGVGCKQYTACPKEYPIVFCTTTGLGHQDQQNSAVPGFKKFFDLMNP
jgi:poly(3-hydroxybutyrate) depolymerase